jgi:hypothetical protein
VLNQATHGGLLTLPAGSNILGALTGDIVKTCLFVASQIPGGSLPTLPGLPSGGLCLPGVLPPIPGVCP